MAFRRSATFSQRMALSSSRQFLTSSAARNGYDKIAQILFAHFPDVPKIDLDRVPHHFGDAGLAGNEHRHVIGHGLKGRDAEGFRDARHDVEVAHRVHMIHLLILEEAGKMEMAADAQLRHPADHVRQHVPAARHDEPYIRDAVEHQLGGLHKVVRPFLER